MILGTHTILYAEGAEDARAFFRDVLGLGSVDAGEGWLIFALPPGELGVHPIEAGGSGGHELYLVCDDIGRTVEELRGKGVEFVGDVTDQGWGLLTSLRIPGGGELGLYEPRHPTALQLQSRSGAGRKPAARRKPTKAKKVVRQKRAATPRKKTAGRKKAKRR